MSQFALSPTAAQIGVVEFSNDADTLIGLSGDSAAVRAAIDGASAAGGGTSVSDGLALGLSVIQGTAARADVPSTILLLTDGVQTVDGNDQTAIAQAAVVKNAGVSIVSVGFGGARTSTINAIASQPTSDFAYFGSDMEAIRAHFGGGALCELTLAPKAPPQPTLPPAPPRPPGALPTPPLPPSSPPSPPPCEAELELVLVLDKSGSVASVQSSILAFARDLVAQFTLSATGTQMGVVEFSNDAETLIGLSSSLADLYVAIDGASPAGGGTKGGWGGGARPP